MHCARAQGAYSTMRTVFHSPFNRSLQPHHAHSAAPVLAPVLSPVHAPVLRRPCERPSGSRVESQFDVAPGLVDPSFRGLTAVGCLVESTPSPAQSSPSRPLTYRPNSNRNLGQRKHSLHGVVRQQHRGRGQLHRASEHRRLKIPRILNSAATLRATRT